jgi:hypothetical protein
MNKKIHIRAYGAMKLSKKQERLIVIGLAAYLIGYFCYQVAYGFIWDITYHTHAHKINLGKCKHIAHAYKCKRILD